MLIQGAGLLTVTDVQVTDDLKIAKVYLSFLENKKPVDEIIGILKEKKREIRHHVGNNIDLRYTPDLRFYYDESMEYAEKINKMIKKIHNNG